MKRTFPTCLAIALASLALWSAPERTGASATPTVPVPLQEQLKRADHVAHVVIVAKESLERVDNGPHASCGLRYRVRVVEQFKGQLDAPEVAFVTERFLLWQKLLVPGDHVLVLLRKVTGIARPADVERAVGLAEEGNFAELVALSMKPATEACQRARGPLYLPDFEENIFLIRFDRGANGWMEFSASRTPLSPEFGTPQLAKREALPGGGYISHEPDRIQWPRVRAALKKGVKTN